MSHDADDDALLEIALAVSEGTHLEWDALKRQVSADETAVVDELEAINRLSLSRRAPTPSVPFAPQRWGHLHILGELPSRFGETRYSARDDGLGKEVVLTLVGPLNGDAQRTEQLLEQARARTRVVHPSLAAAYGADYTYDRVGYWAERLDGRPLSESVATGTKFGTSRACEIVTAIAGAVGALHAVALTSGGVSAERVVESAGGLPVLVASMWPNAPTIASGESHGASRDMFDLIALLVLLLSGVEVQNPADPSAVVARIREMRPDARPPLLAVIERGISPDVSLRYQTPADLVEALRTATADSPVSSEWVIGFSVTALVVLLLLWYAFAAG